MLGGGGQKGKNQDNFNSILNKIHFFKKNCQSVFLDIYAFSSKINMMITVICFSNSFQNYLMLKQAYIDVFVSKYIIHVILCIIHVMYMNVYLFLLIQMHIILHSVFFFLT